LHLVLQFSSENVFVFKYSGPAKAECAFKPFTVRHSLCAILLEVMFSRIVYKVAFFWQQNFSKFRLKEFLIKQKRLFLQKFNIFLQKFNISFLFYLICKKNEVICGVKFLTVYRTLKIAHFCIVGMQDADFSDFFLVKTMSFMTMV
jgi:hypothetical protein